MAYFSPYIDTTGMHIPTYEDTRNDLINQMKQIFGDDIYVDEDSADYQMISIFAKKIFDTNCLAQLAYNNRTPLNAIGVGLDNCVVYANIHRKPATYSEVELTITGNPSTVIQNGEASDGSVVWSLPEEVVIPEAGTITVECHSKEKGNFGAMPNTINQIVTPTYGWLSVTNNYAASPGLDIESDASLRGRYGMSTRLPSQTVFEGMIAALENLENVTRVVGYENDTGLESTASVPGNIPAGLPAHSVTFVVEGESDDTVATTILNSKTPGCYTNGTTAVELETITGNVNTIRFYRPTYDTVKVKVELVKLGGYNADYVNKIKQAVSDYISSMKLGENVYRSIIWSVATSTMDSIKSPAFSVTDIKFSTDGGTTYSSSDVIQNFYNAAVTTTSDVVVEVS